MAAELFKVKQKFNVPELKDIEEEVFKQLASINIAPDSRIAIGVGSRGIANLSDVVRATVKMVKKLGGNPFIVPAMGSHGGATAEGQQEVLAGYGVTEETMGAPVISSMATNMIGKTKDGIPVYFDRNAAGADGIIVINRVKPHTDFHSALESGLVKMLVIGFGKQAGAKTVHISGVDGLKNVIPQTGEVILEKLPIIGGVGILENAYDKVAKIEFIPADKLYSREPELVLEAKSLMASLPVTGRIDVLVVQETGKNVSGVGLDPNITGRRMIRGQEEPNSPEVQNIVVLDLTEESHGNALGVGLADVITKRLFNKINLDITYANVITSGFLQRGFIPIIAETDEKAINIGISTINRRIQSSEIRLMVIKNTLEIEELYLSPALFEEVKDKENIEVLAGPYPLSFTENGELKLF
ncbi:MAG: lactate racemase domain-containing protein [Bacillota bacterium]|nr:lactate racemase domain-containing protein [Bacillota bacterium]